MKPRPVALLIGGGLTALAMIGACGSTDLDAGPGPVSGLPPLEDGTAPNDGGGEGSLLSTWMRLAHLDPRLGSIDLCVQAPGASSFGSPLFASGGVFDAGATPDEGFFPDATEEEEGMGAFETGALDVSSDASSTEASVDAEHPDVGIVEASSGDEGTEDATEDVGFDASEPSGPGPGVLPLNMSRYYELTDAGTFLFAIIRAGATCGDPLFTQEVTLDPGKRTTVVLLPAISPRIGSGSPDAATYDASPMAPGRLLVFTDEPDEVSNAPRTRFISVASTTDPTSNRAPVSVALLNAAAKVWPLAAAVPPDSFASPSSVPPVVDSLGYHDGNSIEGSLAIRVSDPTGTLSWTSATRELNLLAGTVHTGFILGVGTQVAHVLWCDDGARAPFLTPCILLSP